jgi:hypothetical protein
MQQYVTEPEAYLEPRLSADGFGARPATTSIDVFKATVAAHGDRPALYLKRKSPEVGYFQGQDISSSSSSAAAVVILLCVLASSNLDFI